MHGPLKIIMIMIKFKRYKHCTIFSHGAKSQIIIDYWFGEMAWSRPLTTLVPAAAFMHVHEIQLTRVSGTDEEYKCLGIMI